MSMRRIFIVIHSLSDTGPNKGAAALCNGLVNYADVTLVPLKQKKGEGELHMDPRVKVLSLVGLSWREKLSAYREGLIREGGRNKVISLSMCFHADLFNFFMAPYAKIVSSVRGNLIGIYYHEYGWKGLCTAFFHLLLLHRFDHVTAMSYAMLRQLRKFGLHHVSIIQNFIDEKSLEGYRILPKHHQKGVRFVYLASLTRRKCPQLLINAISQLHKNGINCVLDVIGDGPLFNKIKKQVDLLDMNRSIILHGHVTAPYEILQKADYMVLPSKSEGVPRAVLESLFFGKPCILRDVDAHREIIEKGVNGELFLKDRELVDVMTSVAQNVHYLESSPSILLPEAFRQEKNVQSYLDLLLQLGENKEEQLTPLGVR